MTITNINIENTVNEGSFAGIKANYTLNDGTEGQLEVSEKDLIRIYFDAENKQVIGPLGEAKETLPDPVAIGEAGAVVRYFLQLAVDNQGNIVAAPLPYAIADCDRPYIGWDAVRKMLSLKDIESENIYTLCDGNRLPVVFFGEISQTGFIPGVHYFNMDHVDDDSTFMSTLDSKDTIFGYKIEKGSPTFTGININSRTKPEELIAGLKSVALLSDTVTAKNGIRKKTPGNWLWYMDPETEEEEIHVSLQCMNAVGALDRHHEPTGGCGCTMHNAENKGSISADHNGRVLAFTYVNKYFVPRNVDVENMTYERLCTYTDKDNADLKKHGGWIIWEAYDSEDQLNEQFGPSDFYTSGMYHFGPGDRDYHHMHMAGVRILPE